MIIFFAGAKEETKSEPFSDPRVAVGHELNLMTTFDELRKGLHLKKRKRFLNGLKRRKKTGCSGKELWKWIPGYLGRYKVSTRGRVKSVKRQCMTGGGKHGKNARTVPEKSLKPCPDTNGYLAVNLYKGKKGSMERKPIANLVLETFVGPKPSREFMALHKNDDKTNNKLDNLYWGTPKSNIEDCRRNGNLKKAKGENHGNSKLTEEDVRTIRKLYEKNQNYSKIARRFGVEINCIKRIVLRRTWSHVK